MEKGQIEGDWVGAFAHAVHGGHERIRGGRGVMAIADPGRHPVSPTGPLCVPSLGGEVDRSIRSQGHLGHSGQQTALANSPARSLFPHHPSNLSLVLAGTWLSMSAVDVCIPPQEVCRSSPLFATVATAHELRSRSCSKR